MRVTGSGISPSGAATAHIARSTANGIRTGSEIAAAESDRGHGGEGGVNELPGRPAHNMQGTSPHPSRPVAGRHYSGRDSVRGVSSQAARAANYPAAALPDAAAGAFWQHVAAGRVRLSATEDQLVWDLRAAHWRWDYIARHILERRAGLASRAAASAAKQARAAYRRERGIA